MSYTTGFRSQQLETTHFLKHKAKLGYSNLQDYLSHADSFLGGAKDTDTEECFRISDGALVRYNSISQELGVLLNNVILTYFKADPAVHRRGSNQIYFQEECAS